MRIESFKAGNFCLAFAALLSLAAYASESPSGKPLIPNLVLVDPDAVTNVHLVPHSHSYLGWLKTMDAYQYGTNNTVTWARVDMIFTNIVESLVNDPSKRFSWAEIRYFSKWYEAQDGDMQAKVKGLVKQGRLEFVNGGWSAHDEATTSYDDIINNMYWGHSYLLLYFEVLPSVGWQVNAFGHSATNARLFAEMGLDAIFFARMDWQDKQRRLGQQEMEFLWRPAFDHLGKSTEIFAHCLYDGYMGPEGFRFDAARSADDPIVDDPTFETYNVDSMVATLHSYVLKQQKSYKSNHILIPMGGDFFWSNSAYNFASLDKLIQAYNAEYDDSHLSYSTPSEYIKAVNE